MLELSRLEDREKLESLISEDVEQYCKDFYEQGFRSHLGASLMGEPCNRKLWYTFRWCKKPDFDGRMLRLFNVGHSAEPRFINYLRGIGFEVKEFSNPILNYNDNQNYYFWSDTKDSFCKDVSNNPIHVSEALKRGVKPNQFRISGAKGHYGGSLDGMCIPPERYNIVGNLVLLNEYKTNNTGPGYAKVETDGVAKAKSKHFAQMCQYGFHYKLKYGLYIIENKNDSDITFKIVELDWQYGEALQKKAENIIFSQEPPPRIAENPSFYNCKYCDDFQGICHRGEAVDKNCRSCRHAVPVENAEWRCSRFEQNIPADFLPLGCNDWLSI